MPLKEGDFVFYWSRHPEGSLFKQYGMVKYINDSFALVELPGPRAVPTAIEVERLRLVKETD